LGVHTQHCECPAHARGQRELEGLAAVRSGARVVGDLGSHFSHRFAAPGLIRRHILHHAAETPLYGSWMIEELREHGYEISPGALYPMLHGLAHKGGISRCGRRVLASARGAYTGLMGGRIHGDIQDPAFIADLEKSTGRSLRLHFTQRGQFNARPVSLISLSAAAKLSGLPPS
jgi:PadR family transcriptional regulator PadR